MKTKFSLLILAGLVITFFSCDDNIERTVNHYTDEEYEILSEQLDIPRELYEYGQDQESFIINVFPTENNRTLGTGNEIGNHLATLGRVLFYDTKLSINESVSCASCHQQHLAFADDVAFSEGFDGDISFRNSLPLGNTVGFETAYGSSSFSSFGGLAQFGWDEANKNIQSQSLAAITSSVEMGMHDMQQVVDRLSGDPVYSVLFNKAFGTNVVSETRVLDALDRFINSIVSNQSKFDEAAMATKGNSFIADLHQDFPEFTVSENRGKALYNNSCASCHSMDHSFTAIAKANNGLDVVYSDKGVGEITGSSFDNGVFKVPFLRNIELTGPYMHDGRFKTLAEVIDFYSNGIQNHSNLNNNLTDFAGNPLKFNFSDQDKSDLIAYLETLTDEKLVNEIKWSDPFR